MDQGQGGPGYPAGGGAPYGYPAGGAAPFGGPPNPYEPPRAAARPSVTGRQATVGEVLAGYPRAIGLAFKTVVGPYLVFALASLLLVTAPQALLRYLRFRFLMEGDFGLANVMNYASIGLSLLAIFVLVPSFGLARAMRTAMVDGPEAVGGFGGAMKAAFSRYAQVLGNILLVGIGLAVGAVLCVLPLFVALYFFFMAPDLVAACGEDAWSGIVRSCRMAVRNAGSFLTLIGLLIVIGLLSAGVGWGLTFALTSSLGPGIALLVSQSLIAVLGLPVGFLVWVLMVSSFVTVETTESSPPLRA